MFLEIFVYTRFHFHMESSFFYLILKLVMQLFIMIYCKTIFVHFLGKCVVASDTLNLKIDVNF